MSKDQGLNQEQQEQNLNQGEAREDSHAAAAAGSNAEIPSVIASLDPEIMKAIIPDYLSEIPRIQDPFTFSLEILAEVHKEFAIDVPFN